MDTEAAFQAALDADPTNGGLREVFADWLDDMGDPRGPGYRALGRLGLYPVHLKPTISPEHDHWMFQLLSTRHKRDHYTFDADNESFTAWFRLVCTGVFGSHWHRQQGGRRGCENAFAIAWSRLSPEVQDRILSAVEVPA